MPLGDPGEVYLSVKLDCYFFKFPLQNCREGAIPIAYRRRHGTLCEHLGVQCLALKGMLAEL